MTPEILAEIYHPLTANTDEGYREIEPCEALKPWMRCLSIRLIISGFAAVLQS